MKIVNGLANRIANAVKFEASERAKDVKFWFGSQGEVNKAPENVRQLRRSFERVR